MITYTPTGAHIGEALIENTPSGAGLFQAIGGHYASPAQAIDDIVDNAISAIIKDRRARGCSGGCDEVIVRVEEGGAYVDISVCDNGCGIADLSAALTISECSGERTPYNEHGCGLKSALSYLCGGQEVWMIETRTAEDEAADRYRCVSAPYAAIDGKMIVETYQGRGDIQYKRGTLISVRCSKAKFADLRPANKRAKADFLRLCGCLKEELAYTYANILEEDGIKIKVICRDEEGAETCSDLAPLKPLWEEKSKDYVCTADFGGGEVTVRYCYGTIRASRQNLKYYKRNMDSSGLEIRLNGRCIERGLYSKVYDCALHNSSNGFLAQIDLRSEDSAALPPTETTKNAFLVGNTRTKKLFDWLRVNIVQPTNSIRDQERRLVDELEKKCRQEPDTRRVERELSVGRAMNMNDKIDLWVVRPDGATIYEAKAKRATGGDLFQLLRYTINCSLDGIPVKESVLIAETHSEGVSNMVDLLNTQRDPTGEPYHFVLRTWADEGISA